MRHLRVLALGSLAVLWPARSDGAESRGASASASGSATEATFVESNTGRLDQLPVATTVDTIAPTLVPPFDARQQFSEQVRIEQERMVREWMETPLEPQAIYFPPAPPVLGATLPGLGLPADDVIQYLAPFVAEPFYAPLSTRLAEEDLGRRLRARLDAYRADRAAALAELRTRLETMRQADPDTRRQALADLAVAQEPILSELEGTADELRREFFRARFLGGGGDWSRYRSWRLDPVDPARASRDVRLAELRVLRAAAFYQEGLSPAQRRLVRELVIELATILQAPGAGAGLAPGDPARVIFFSPDLARVPLPADLPAPILELIHEYTRLKDALKHELRQRLVALDGERNVARRVRALQDLAGEQSMRLADLETRAEAIRAACARVPGMLASSPAPTLPGALDGRVSAYLRAKGELQKIAQDRLAQALQAFDRTERDRELPRRPVRRAALVRATVDKFHADHGVRITALDAEADAIRDELVRLAPSPTGEDAGRPVEVLLAEFAEAFKRQQLVSLYAEYWTAVWEPGLSPAQRRLLFAGALAELKLTGALRDQQVSTDEAGPQP